MCSQSTDLGPNYILYEIVQFLLITDFFKAKNMGNMLFNPAFGSCLSAQNCIAKAVFLPEGRVYRDFYPKILRMLWAMS